MKKLLLCLMLLSPMVAFASTCKYLGADGQIIYSNLPVQNAVKTECFPSPKSTASGGGKPSAETVGFPRVAATEQRKRDDIRRTILLDELAKERDALLDAKKRGGSGTNTSIHERNIQMLEKELGGVKP